MDELRFHRKDGIFIAVCLIILVAGILVGLRYFKEAFPEATVDFRYDRGQTRDMALSYLNSVDLAPPSDFKSASRFGYDDHAKTYLEKELGVDGARRFLGHPIRLWYWQHRWFRPSTKEEFRVYVTPEGEVVWLQHEVEEQAAGADLPEAEARVLAEKFLFGPMKQDSTRLTFLESQRTGRPHRSDWSFTYKAVGIEPVKDSEYRYTVGLIGDRISSYREYLHVPQAWEASFQKLRSYNEMAGQFDGIGLVLTAVAMVVVLFLRLRKRDIRWKTAIWFGIVCVVLVLLNRINEIPLELYGYDTTSSWSGFWTSTIFIGIISALSLGLIVMLMTAAAETVYRERYPDKLALPRLFSAQGLRTKRAFKSILLGVTLTSFFFSYQIAFYLIAGRLGAWSPSDVPYDNLLNTAMPWLAVLFMGFFPAVSEEFMSRMFSIPLLQKLFRNKFTWLAVIIPALIWGFGHSGYPNEPFYIRGVEVGLAGIVIGVVMLRFGILPTLVWHYTVDALYTAMLLFRSKNPYFVLTAAVAVGLLVVPLLVALIAYFRKGSFAPEAGVRNADLGTAAEEAPVAVPSEAALPATAVYQRLPSNRRMFAVVLLVIGIAAWLIPVTHVGDFISYPVTKQAAIQVVADSLRATSWAKPDTLQMAAFSETTRGGVGAADPLSYLLKHAGSVEKFNQIADQTLVEGRWRVLAWKPENRLQFVASVDSRTGKIVNLRAIIPEEMPGDSMSVDRARQMVDSVLASRGEDLSRLDLKNQDRQDRPHRLDHGFTYEAREGDARNVAEAKYRRGGSVDGSWLHVTGSAWYKVPETWQRERRAQTVLRTLKTALTFVIIAGLAIWAIAILGSRTRRGLVRWKRALLYGIVPALVAFIAGLNEFYLAKSTYFGMIATPWSVFRAELIVEWLISAAVMYILFAVGLAILSALYPDALPWLRRAERRAAWLDALLAAAGGIGALMLVRSFAAWLAAWNPEWILFSGWDIPDWIAAPVPLMVMLATSLSHTLITALLFAFFAYLWQGPMKKPLWRALLLVAGVVMVIPTSFPDANEWLYALLVNIVRVALAYVVLRFLVAGRAALLLALAAGLAIFTMASQGLGTGNGFVMVNTVAFVVIAVITLAFWLGGFGGSRKELHTTA